MGAATASALAAQGARAFLTYFREPTVFSDGQLASARSKAEGGVVFYRANQQQTAQHLLDDIQASGGMAAACEIDLAIPAHIPALFDRCERELGDVDILVNNRTYCALDTYEPSLVTSAGFGIHLVAGRDLDVNSAVNVRAYVLLIATLATADGSSGQASAGIHRVSWLRGRWEAASGQQVVEEQWMAPRGGSMLGMSHTVRDGRVDEFEFLVLRESGATGWPARPGLPAGRRRHSCR